jgi:hypothetical protein
VEDFAFFRTIAWLEDIRAAFMSHRELLNLTNEWCKKWLIDCQFCAYENAYHSFFSGGTFLSLRPRRELVSRMNAFPDGHYLLTGFPMHLHFEFMAVGLRSS